MKNVVVVGGGTAGWISSCFIKKRYPEHHVSLIESSSVGILGAGEGGTPNLRSVLVDELGFDEEEFLKSVNGTKKYGIIFKGWHNDSDHSFVHGFAQDGSENDLYSYHFNARLFADFLKSKGIKMGIDHIEGDVSSFSKKDGVITGIVLKSGNEVKTDFIIDCSGFFRLIIGDLYKTKWNSYENELLVNSALPFFINKKNPEINQKTIAEAADHGWIWRIPLQDRWGCGYLYREENISEEEIKSEILKIHGNEEITINKKIKFNAGSFENVWVENSIAIGLSGGFLEPLEATSIMTVIFQLRRLPNDLFDYSKRDEYNISVKNYNNQNMMFLRHHYNCSRQDSKFWKTYRSKKVPETLEKIYSTFGKSDDISEILANPDGILTFTKDQYRRIFDNNFLKREKTLI